MSVRERHSVPRADDRPQKKSTPRECTPPDSSPSLERHGPLLNLEEARVVLPCHHPRDIRQRILGAHREQFRRRPRSSCPTAPCTACPVSSRTPLASGSSTSTGLFMPNVGYGTRRERVSTFGNAFVLVSCHSFFSFWRTLKLFDAADHSTPGTQVCLCAPPCLFYKNSGRADSHHSIAPKQPILAIRRS